MKFVGDQIKTQGSAEGSRLLSLSNISKFGFLAAAGLFLLSTLFSLPPFRSQDNSFTLARYFLFNFAIVTAIVETCGLLVGGVRPTRYQLATYVLCVCGCGVLGVATLRSEGYNQGMGYMVAAFLLSLSSELKIIRMLVPKSRLQEQRHRFLQLLSCCCSLLMFFFGALVVESGLEQSDHRVVSSGLNFLSGVLMGLAAFYLLKRGEYEGYRTVEVAVSSQESE